MIEMGNLIGVIIVGVLSYVVVSILVGALQIHLENGKLKEKIEKLERYKEIYENELKLKTNVLGNSLTSHKFEINMYKARIKKLERYAEICNEDIDELRSTLNQK